MGAIKSPPRQMRVRCLLAACAATFLAGCVASTTVIRNTDPSDELKARPATATYKRVLLIPPKDDPRLVVPRVVHGLEAMGLEVQVLDPAKPIELSQGTGFFVTTSGHLLTCAHVLGDEKLATITLSGKLLLADVVAADKTADIALLKLQEPLPETVQPLSFRDRTHAYSMGEEVYTIGYPLSSLLGEGARMTKGLLSATNGLHDDPKTMQVTAEVQPGNSGGPLLDQQGQVIGIIQKTLNPWRVAQATGGALPQNINFSIKNEPILAFLQSASPSPLTDIRFDKGTGLGSASSAVVKIQAGRAAEKGNRQDTLVVKVDYHSIWDMWYRFQYFVLTAVDFETHEPLFATGQGHDNLVSTEDVVIKDTLRQFHAALATK